jgi:hypothetical protein
MSILSRAAAAAALFTLLAAPGLEAQGKISVTLASGPHAGTHEMEEACEGQPNSYPSLYIMGFRTGVYDRQKLPYVMEFFTASKPGKPDAFVVSVKFHGQDYQIFTIPREYSKQAPMPSGRGTVTVKQSAAGRVATFSGETKDGVKMQGTIDCRTRA